MQKAPCRGKVLSLLTKGSKQTKVLNPLSSFFVLKKMV